MKIWYQTYTAYRYDPTWDEYGKTVEEQCKWAARPDTEVYVTGLPVYMSGLEDYKFWVYYHNSQCLSNMLRAEKEGFDAFILGCSSDSALVEGRGIVSIPVIGITQSNMYMAGMLGECFAIVTSPHLFVEMYRQLVRLYGLESKYLQGNYSLEISEMEIAQAIKEPEPLARKFKKVAKKAVADGASVIIPLPAFIHNLFYKSGGLNNLDGATILNPIAIAIKVAEAFVDLKQLGIEVSRKSQVYAYPGRKVVERVLETYTSVFKIDY
ncbi:aspartate/glutamate racemase family protein [Chloroflexota bacterium]